MPEKRVVESLDLEGGVLCLDFANTVDSRFDLPTKDYLSDYTDLVLWASHAGAFKEQLANRLIKIQEQDPARAERIFQHSIQLRETLYRIFQAYIQGEKVTPGDLEQLNDWISRSFSQIKLNKTEKGFTYRWKNENDLELVLWEITKSAADLLTKGNLKRVKQCPSCGWVFRDASKNRSRKWCSMQVCGNRAKAMRHYKRSQA
ncbi:MAG: CGNR zinc finger domain-containing protein [Anaerolineales bacterium]|jgi:predicted RNA-binding Zn ribbon-like protein